MKINLGASVPLGDAHVYQFASDSRPGMLHYVMVFPVDDPTRTVAGIAKCSCEAFQYRGSCKHVDKVREESV